VPRVNEKHHSDRISFISFVSHFMIEGIIKDNRLVQLQNQREISSFCHAICLPFLLSIHEFRFLLSSGTFLDPQEVRFQDGCESLCLLVHNEG
jgi:hypothetical protein